MPLELGQILEQMKRTSPLGKQLDQAIIWERWPEIAGAALYTHARPVCVKKTQLHVEVESSVWMNKLSFRREGMVRRINRLAGKRLVDEIFLLLLDENGQEPETDQA